MPGQAAVTLEALTQQVTKTTDVIKAAKQTINGITARVEAAVAAALANGATAEELAPVTDEIALLKTNTDDLAVAVEANT